ncbi:transposase domain-containing protein [Gigaspora margarita]|uniref:Transposase domain-containing protein n=1 Tax=Gigaspora margarita TaxID=4874 RepID=A0A8H3WWL6_GIGMA|nr:transposase domain-containing protein [Gigaspora margarita]
MSNNIYQQVMVGFSNEQVSQYRAIKKLTSIVQIEPKWIDMCYSDSTRSKELQYQYNYTTSPEYDNNNCGDIFDREKYKDLVENGYGVECCDGLRNQEIFILHAFVVSWLGDTPALTKLMCTTGHNSYQGCRYCELQDTYFNHIYYPTTPPKKKNGTTYDPAKLPQKTHYKYLQ